MKNTQLKATTCYLDNLSQSLKDADVLFSEDDGDLVIKGVDDYLALIRLTYRTFTNALKDCSGKEIKIELGNSITANFVETLIKNILDEKP